MATWPVATPDYLSIDLLPRRAGRRTDSWSVRSATSGASLGDIAWYGPWRQFVFYPAEGSLWSAGCQMAVVDFIAAQMRARRG